MHWWSNILHSSARIETDQTPFFLLWFAPLKWDLMRSNLKIGNSTELKMIKIKITEVPTNLESDALREPRATRVLCPEKNIAWASLGLTGSDLFRLQLYSSRVKQPRCQPHICYARGKGQRNVQELRASWKTRLPNFSWHWKTKLLVSMSSCVSSSCTTLALMLALWKRVCGPVLPPRHCAQTIRNQQIRPDTHLQLHPQTSRWPHPFETEGLVSGVHLWTSNVKQRQATSSNISRMKPHEATWMHIDIISTLGATLAILWVFGNPGSSTSESARVFYRCPHITLTSMARTGDGRGTLKLQWPSYRFGHLFDIFVWSAFV